MRIVGRDVPEIGVMLDEYGFPQIADVFGQPLDLTPDSLRGYLANDKKRSGDTISLVVPKRIGECEIKNVPVAELESWLS